MEKQISIIIPTYNMERYIGKCLDSLLIPELDAVEVLVVNDGSKDRSSEIAHSYAKRYPDSIRVIDKENGNYGSCINAALPLATGRYVKVLDADDTFDTDTFSEFVRALSECEEDVVITDFMEVDENGHSHPNHRHSEFSFPSGKALCFDNLDRTRFPQLAMHGIAYRRTLFDNINYRQTEGISYTDTEWRIQPLCHANTFRYIDTGFLYRYLIGREGQTMAPDIYAKSQLKVLRIWLSNARYLNEVSSSINQAVKELIEREISYNIYRIYTITSQTKDLSTMYEASLIDAELKSANPSIYRLVGEIKYYPYVSYRWVSAIRKCGFKPVRVPARVNMKVKMVKMISSLKQKLS